MMAHIQSSSRFRLMVNKSAGKLLSSSMNNLPPTRMMTSNKCLEPSMSSGGTKLAKGISFHSISSSPGLIQNILTWYKDTCGRQKRNHKSSPWWERLEKATIAKLSQYKTPVKPANMKPLTSFIPKPKIPIPMQPGNKMKHWKKTAPKLSDEKKPKKDMSGKLCWWSVICELWNITHTTEDTYQNKNNSMHLGGNLCQVVRER